MINKLAVFDFDSTLMDGETLEFFAKELGYQEKIKTITDKAMRGELDFFESLIERVQLLKGIPIEKIDSISKTLPLMPGAKEIVDFLKSQNYKVVCFSGGFKNATSYFAEYLGLDAEFSNILHSKDGYLTGLVGASEYRLTAYGEKVLLDD